jgi:(p)ppGpp synthase/HD superfamily hydrolase
MKEETNSERRDALPPDEELAELPLHTITLEFGQEGLARRFELEKAKLSEEAQVLVGKAYELAMRIHANDVRKSDEPTINHLLRVAVRIMHHYGVDDPIIIAAALLHDSVEDHPDLVVGANDATQDQALESMAGQMNPEVAELIGAVTNPPYDPSRDKLEQYHEHVRELLSNGNPKAKIIKASDFTDNALGLKYLIKDTHNLPESVTYRAQRYLPIVGDFEEAFKTEGLPISETVRQHILEQLNKTKELLTELSKSEI